jgi:putative tryptophan/tyrosine transport system substrate-binding protein
MRRRGFVAGLLLVTGIQLAGRQRALSGKVYRIAFVDPVVPTAKQTESTGLLVQELRLLNYLDGQNLLIERFSGEGRAEHFPELARDVVNRNPDLIFAMGYRLVLDFKTATSTIPIVGMMGDPVAVGIVPNLARPGGNITGVATDASAEIDTKRLEILKESVPTIMKVALLVSAKMMESPRVISVREAARKIGVSLVTHPLNPPFDEAEYRRVFASIGDEAVDAVIVGDQIENFANRRLIVELLQKRPLPAIYPYPDCVTFGGLMAYSIDWSEVTRHCAVIIDRILKGIKPGDIPIYLPSKFSLGINLKTASSLGLTMPSSLLARADEIVE